MIVKRALILFCLALAGAPAHAQDAPAADPAPEDGLSLMERGADLLLRGMIAQMEPALDEAQKALAELEPALRDLLAKIDDIRYYDAPEVLENGDILIRRKAGAPPPAFKPAAPDTAPPAGEIEL